ncbi:SWI/SNF-related matrix-associated actin-dependent regulator of chromatin subfamily A-like protein 1 [Penaeus vannamei]|uniref:SWI/SNF-related matrix-associated actin-dependent regulator of chromatin subfamily A-like protein 1 n=1 Tax=Penaeus vannamei TaxID=6689 RepID=UPI000F6897F3|nr:SWI/SNF-related matrix-associated actin-dependent regulator of chromatin subfamily A-like protein 1 [Penaeus vannamei]
MSGLTKDQLQRMEENRKKALARRAAILAAAGNSNNNQPAKPNNSQPMAGSGAAKPSSSAATQPYNRQISPTGNLSKPGGQQSTFSQNTYPKSGPPGQSSQPFSNQNSVPGKSASNFYKTGQTNINNNTQLGKSSATSSSFSNSIQSKAQSQPPGNTSKQTGDGAKPVFGKTVNGTFRLMSRERFMVEVGYHQQMIEIFKTMTTKKYDVETKRWNFELSEHDKLVAALAPLRPAVCISPLPSFVRRILKAAQTEIPASCVDLFGLDPKLLDALMPFQHEGVCYGVSHNGRALIADDMGLGKTIQALGVAAYYRQEWPLLVVTPSSVRYSWAKAIERWVGSVSRGDIVVVGSGRDPVGSSDVVIMSYDLLARRAKEVQDCNFQVVIMDESHMLKSFKTARYKAAAPIMKKAKRVLLLSGTPALSRPSELYTQISGIDPSIFPSFQEFGVRYCAGKQLPWGWDFSGSSNLEELQILLEARIMIRRLKSQVLDQLPSKQRMTVILDPTSIHASTKAMEDAAKQFGAVKGVQKHGALLQFFAESSRAKWKAVTEYIKELFEAEKKFLVFAHHQIMLDKLCETCENAKVEYIRIDGKTPGEVRQNYVNKFQTKDSVKVAILSITAANTGLTLTAAQLVVFAELFWNPGILVQAEDRAHRIGQEDCVMVQYLVAQGTADDYIWPLVQSKLEVLGKAGLSKDNFSSAESTRQKESEQESILKYFSEVGDDCFSDDDLTDEPQAKRMKT